VALVDGNNHGAVLQRRNKSPKTALQHIIKAIGAKEHHYYVKLVPSYFLLLLCTDAAAVRGISN
jgi:hypothetical protein